MPDADTPELGASERALVGGGRRAKRSRRPRRRRVDADLAAGLGIDERQLADVGQVVLARVVDLDREHLVPRRDRGQRLAASRAGRGSRTRRRPGRRAERSPQRTAARPTTVGDGRARGVLVDRRSSCGRRAAWRAARRARRSAATRRSVGATERHDPEPVAALGGEVADGDRDALGDVGLAPQRGPERHRRRDVEHEPRGERPLRDVDADVRDRGAGRDVPVDPADVVAGLIRTDLRQLEPAAQVVGAELAGDEAVDAPADRQVERAEQRDRGRAGTRRLLGSLLRVGRPIMPSAPSRRAAGRRPPAGCGRGSCRRTPPRRAP